MSSGRTARGQSTAPATADSTASAASSSSATATSSANLTAGGRGGRSESSPPAAYQGRGATAAKQSSAAAAARARHRASSSPKTSGDEISSDEDDDDDAGSGGAGRGRRTRARDDDSAADDTDPDEKDDAYDEDDLGADMIARAAQDFASMRLSIARFDSAAAAAADSPAAASAASPAAARAASASSADSTGGLAVGAPSRDELRVNAMITSAETAHDAKGDYILYQLSVTAGGSTTGLAWKVGRRFREFEALHKELCTRFGKDHLPALPKKALRRSLEPEYVRRKKTELAKYVEDLMLDPAVASCEPLAHFLIVNIQDILRSSIENLRCFAQRGAQIKAVEAGLWKAQLDRKKAEKSVIEANKDRDEARDRVIMVEAALEAAVNTARQRAEADAQSRLDTLQAEWETKYAELTAHAKALHKEKKSALKAVQELDTLTRKLKAEKKILVKEVKGQQNCILRSASVVLRTAPPRRLLLMLHSLMPFFLSLLLGSRFSLLLCPSEQRARMAALGALGAPGMITESSGGSEAGTGTVSPQGTRRSPQFSPSYHAHAGGAGPGSLSLSRHATGNGEAAGAMSVLPPLDTDDTLARALASPGGLMSPEPVDGDVAAMLERNRKEELEQQDE